MVQADNLFVLAVKGPKKQILQISQISASYMLLFMELYSTLAVVLAKGFVNMRCKRAMLSLEFLLQMEIFDG